MKDLWLPIGHQLSDGSEIRSLLFSGEDWQIMDTDGPNSILLARPKLTQRWNQNGFLDESLFDAISFGTESFRILFSHKRYVLAPVENVGTPENKLDALAFALALRESRELSDGVSFHDAIYVEQYSRMLPTWTLTPSVDDGTVLGTWITGGVIISTDSFRRLTKLTGWMPANDLAEIIKTAGCTIPEDMNIAVGGDPTTANDSESQPAEETSKSKIFKLPGRPQLEQFFNEHVVDIIFNPEKYRLMGIEFPSAIILHGPPGCGKTFAVERLVEFIDWPSYSISSNTIGSPYIHDTSKKISEVFDEAIENSPSIVVIDEMEAFLPDRQSAGAHQMYRVEEVAEFLRRIPEAINNRVLIVAMTNLLEMIDPAILRRGRFDHIIEIGMPSRVEVSALLDSLLSKLPKDEGLDLDKMLDVLTGKALSDSSFVVREAARLAAKAGKSQLDQECIDVALDSLPKDEHKETGRIGFV